jgi:monoterpene epsilon-lactone hydrolase
VSRTVSGDMSDDMSGHMSGDVSDASGPPSTIRDMSLQMRLLTPVLRARGRSLVSAHSLRDAAAQGRRAASTPPPHEMYQVNHLTSRTVTVDGTSTTVHALVPATDEPRDTPRDICLYLHGGAYIAGLTKQHWDIVNDIAAAGMKVVVPDYGLAPEHEAAGVFTVISRLLRDAVTEAAATGHHVTVAGDSSGGGLAAGTLLRLRGELPVAALALISPWLDVTCSTPGTAEIERSGRDPWLHSAGLREAGALWSRIVGDRDPLVSPLTASAAALRTLPPVRIWTGDRDILSPDAVAFDAALAAAGVPASGHSLHRQPGAFHDYPLLPVPEGRTARADIAGFLTEQCSTAGRNN